MSAQPLEVMDAAGGGAVVASQEGGAGGGPDASSRTPQRRREEGEGGAGEVERFWLPLVVVVGAVVRVMCLALGPWDDAARVTSTEASGYAEAARRLCEAGELASLPTAEGLPGYAAYLAVFHALGMPWWVALAVQVLLSAGVGGALFMIVWRLTGGARAGLLAAGAWAVHPAAVLAAVELSPATLIATAWAGGLALMLAAMQRGGDAREPRLAWGLWVTGGVLLGSAPLVGPVSAWVGVLAAIVVGVGWMAGAESIASRAVRATAAGVLLLAVALPTAAWPLRQGPAVGPPWTLTHIAPTAWRDLGGAARQALLEPQIGRLYAAWGIDAAEAYEIATGEGDAVAHALAWAWRGWATLHLAAGVTGVALLWVRRHRAAAMLAAGSSTLLILIAPPGSGTLVAPLAVALTALAAGGLMAPRRAFHPTLLARLWTRGRAWWHWRREQTTRRVHAAEDMVQRRFMFSPLAGMPSFEDEPQSVPKAGHEVTPEPPEPIDPAEFYIAST